MDLQCRSSTHGLRSGLTLDDADKAVDVMRQAVDRIGDLPELFRQYQSEMAELAKTKPWANDNVWSE